MLRFFIVQHLLSFWQKKVPVSLNATQLFQSFLGYTEKKNIMAPKATDPVVPKVKDTCIINTQRFWSELEQITIEMIGK